MYNLIGGWDTHVYIGVKSVPTTEYRLALFG